MKDYLKPNPEISPDQVVPHAGTSDLTQKEPRHVADSIVDLAREIENSCEATVVLSEPKRQTQRGGEKNEELLLAKWMETYPASK